MKILKMKATFGCLENESMSLKPGLNIITAPNESGKSTWTAFIKAMLYGIDTSERDTAARVADKNRYRPWSGAAMKGVMEVEWKGRKITLERKSRGRILFADFVARDSKTGDEVEELNAQNCGEKLLGVSKEVFERSAFIRQAGVSFDHSNELEKRLLAMVTTGEDGVSFSEADAFLNNQQNKRRHNKTGQLPALEKDIADIDRKLSDLKTVNQRIVEQTGKIERLTIEQEKLQNDLNLIRIREDVEKLGRLRKAQEELVDAQNELHALKEQVQGIPADATEERINVAYRGIDALEALEEQVRVRCMEQDAKEREPVEDIVPPPALKGLTASEAWEKARKDTDEANTLSGRMTIKKQPVLILAALMAVSLLALIFSLNSEFIQTYIPALLLGLFAAALGGFFLWSRNDGMRAQEELSAILHGYRCDSVSGIMDAASSYREKLALADSRSKRLTEDRSKVEEAKADLEKKRTALNGVIQLYAPGTTTAAQARTELERLSQVFAKMNAVKARISAAEQVIDAYGQVPDHGYTAEDLDKFPTGDKLKAGASLSRANADLEIARNALAMYTGERKAMGDPAELLAKREELQAKHVALTGEYEAIEIAREVLREGSDELQSRFAPAINERASEIMNALTGGKYNGVIFDREMNALLEDEEDSTLHKANLLSGGTADQLYLAIRMAICELALPMEEPAPIILDDALVNFDDERMKLAVKLLRKEAKDRQIILFTCHTREQGAEEQAES